MRKVMSRFVLYCEGHACACLGVIILEAICVLSLTPALALSFKVEKRNNNINKFMLARWGYRRLCMAGGPCLAMGLVAPYFTNEK